MAAAADTFARATARRAHATSAQALELAKTALAVAHDTNEHATVRPRMFRGLCALCGEQCRPRERYCHAHEWAA